MKKRIILIGGAGFIGHNLALKLKKNFDVFVVDSLQVNHIGEHSLKGSNNNNLYINLLNQRLDLLKQSSVPIHIVDARDYSLLTSFVNHIKPHIVIHLAAVAHAKKANKDPYSTIDHSMRTLENILDIIRERNIHLIYFSSSMVYGNFKKKIVTEKDRCDPLGIYGTLKFSGEKLVLAYEQVFKSKYTIIRPSALYGPRCVSGRVGQIFIEKSLKKENLIIEGDGNDALDFTYIDDLIQGVNLVIDNPKAINQIYNITYGKAAKIKKLADLVSSYFKGIKVTYKKRDVLMPERGTLSISKAKKELGYKPNFDITKGFHEYILWYKSLGL